MGDYGDIDDVEALSGRYLDGTTSAFSDSTTPTSTQVERWLDQLGVVADIVLAHHGYDVPVTNATVVKALAGFIASFAVDLVNAANSAGRLYEDEDAGNPLSIFMREFGEFVSENSAGLDAVGADRGDRPARGILSRETDEDGDETEPIFQRLDFGESWDWS